MKILVNNKIKALFCRIGACITSFSIVAIIFMKYGGEHSALYIFLCSMCMAIVIMIVCYGYFKEQQKIIETATAQVTEYIMGNPNARISCNEEGELYRLFHKVNALASILNAHVENEVRSKEFLKNTIADISHQLKTPLAALSIYNGILKDEAENLPTIQEFIDLSEQEIDRIETLVENLLKIAKLDAGTILMNKREENVQEMIESVHKHFLFRGKQEEKEICLTGDETLRLFCDQDWLIEAIGNIVKNALDHTKKGDKIQIEWMQFASIMQIVIKDNGSGIHPEDLYFIFKRFYRSRFSKDIPGIGLGLPLSKAIIEAHNGTIEVTSELGIGTAFVINFLIPTKL